MTVVTTYIHKQKDEALRIVNAEFDTGFCQDMLSSVIELLEHIHACK